MDEMADFLGLSLQFMLQRIQRHAIKSYFSAPHKVLPGDVKGIVS
jgi:hypothetical protein